MQQEGVAKAFIVGVWVLEKDETQLSDLNSGIVVVVV